MTLIIFFNYSEYMDDDLKSLEEKISKLILMCGDLREQNDQLRGDLSAAQQQAATLKNNMLLASNKLEGLLDNMPDGMEA